MVAPVSPGTKGTATVGGSGIIWSTNPFAKGGSAATLVLKMHAGLAAVTSGFAQNVQEYAREHAPWEDRTGDARGGLTAEGRQRLTSYSIILYHTVDYGIWLEVRWDGKYAIILPTIEHMGHELMDRLQIALLAQSAARLI
jgi:hypothetical protein